MATEQGSGFTDNHLIWAGIGLAVGFLLKANGWADWIKDEATGKTRFVVYWRMLAADWTSAGMIIVLGLGVTALFPLLGWGPLPPAGTAFLVGVMFLVGLRPLTEKVHAFLDALIARVKGGTA